MRKHSEKSRADADTPVLVVGLSTKVAPSWLHGYGFSVTQCLEANEALKMLSRGHHQAVLCELNLTGLAGKGFLKAVSADFPDVAVVTITGPGELRDGILAMIAGASGYIQTPLHPEIVVASLNSALKRKRLDSAAHL